MMDLGSSNYSPLMDPGSSKLSNGGEGQGLSQPALRKRGSVKVERLKGGTDEDDRTNRMSQLSSGTNMSDAENMSSRGRANISDLHSESFMSSTVDNQSLFGENSSFRNTARPPSYYGDTSLLNMSVSSTTSGGRRRQLPSIPVSNRRKSSTSAPHIREGSTPPRSPIIPQMKRNLEANMKRLSTQGSLDSLPEIVFPQKDDERSLSNGTHSGFPSREGSTNSATFDEDGHYLTGSSNVSFSYDGESSDISSFVFDDESCDELGEEVEEDHDIVGDLLSPPRHDMSFPNANNTTFNSHAMLEALTELIKYDKMQHSASKRNSRSVLEGLDLVRDLTSPTTLSFPQMDGANGFDVEREQALSCSPLTAANLTFPKQNSENTPSRLIARSHSDGAKNNGRTEAKKMNTKSTPLEKQYSSDLESSQTVKPFAAVPSNVLARDRAFSDETVVFLNPDVSASQTSLSSMTTERTIEVTSPSQSAVRRNLYPNSTSPLLRPSPLGDSCPTPATPNYALSSPLDESDHTPLAFQPNKTNTYSVTNASSSFLPLKRPDDSFLSNPAPNPSPSMLDQTHLDPEFVRCSPPHPPSISISSAHNSTSCLGSIPDGPLRPYPLLSKPISTHLRRRLPSEPPKQTPHGKPRVLPQTADRLGDQNSLSPTTIGPPRAFSRRKKSTNEMNPQERELQRKKIAEYLKKMYGGNINYKTENVEEDPDGEQIQRTSFSSKGKRYQIVEEIVRTEETYIACLDVLIDVFYTPLASSALIAPKDLSRIFPKEIRSLKALHSKLLQDLRTRLATWNDTSIIADLLAQFGANNSSPVSSAQNSTDGPLGSTEGETPPLSEDHVHGGGEEHMRGATDILGVYASYFNNFATALSVLRKTLKRNDTFGEFLEHSQRDSRCEGLELVAFLLTPIQRLPRYVLFLNTLISSTDEAHPDHVFITKALARFKEVMNVLNASFDQSVALSQEIKKGKTKKRNKRNFSVKERKDDEVGQINPLASNHTEGTQQTNKKSANRLSNLLSFKKKTRNKSTASSIDSYHSLESLVDADNLDNIPTRTARWVQSLRASQEALDLARDPRMLLRDVSADSLTTANTSTRTNASSAHDPVQAFFPVVPAHATGRPSTVEDMLDSNGLGYYIPLAPSSPTVRRVHVAPLREATHPSTVMNPDFLIQDGPPKVELRPKPPVTSTFVGTDSMSSSSRPLSMSKRLSRSIDGLPPSIFVSADPSPTSQFFHQTESLSFHPSFEPVSKKALSSSHDDLLEGVQRKPASSSFQTLSKRESKSQEILGDMSSTSSKHSSNGMKLFGNNFFKSRKGEDLYKRESASSTNSTSMNTAPPSHSKPSPDKSSKKGPTLFDRITKKFSSKGKLNKEDISEPSQFRHISSSYSSLLDSSEDIKPAGSQALSLGDVKAGPRGSHHGGHLNHFSHSTSSLLSELVPSFSSPHGPRRNPSSLPPASLSTSNLSNMLMIPGYMNESDEEDGDTTVVIVV